jgi:hypothetical protein
MNNELIKNGIIHIKELFKNNDINNFIEIIDKFIENIRKNKNIKIIKNENDIYKYPETFIFINNKNDIYKDNGIINIYNIDYLLKEIDLYFDKNKIKKIIEGKINKKIIYKISNLEIINKNLFPSSLENNKSNMIKCSILLNDLKNYNEGNIKYIKTSHIIDINYDLIKNLEIIIGNKGDCIIYYEKGYHNKSSNDTNKTIYYLNYYFEII